MKRNGKVVVPRINETRLRKAAKEGFDSRLFPTDSHIEKLNIATVKGESSKDLLSKIIKENENQYEADLGQLKTSNLRGMRTYQAGKYSKRFNDYFFFNELPTTDSNGQLFQAIPKMGFTKKHHWKLVLRPGQYEKIYDKDDQKKVEYFQVMEVSMEGVNLQKIESEQAETLETHGYFTRQAKERELGIEN